MMFFFYVRFSFKECSFYKTDFTLINTMIWFVLLLFNNIIKVKFVLEFNKIILKVNTRCTKNIIINLKEDKTTTY